MATCKVNVVKSARKYQGKCGHCGTPIGVGDAYKWWQGRFTPKYVRCMARACSPKPWDRETNPLRSDWFRAEHVMGLAMASTDPEVAAGYIREAMEGIKDTLEERTSAWEDTGLEQSQQYEACTNSMDEFETWLDTMETAAGELEELVASQPLESDYDPNSTAYAKEDDPLDAAAQEFEEAELAWEGDVAQIVENLEQLPEIRFAEGTAGVDGPEGYVYPSRPKVYNKPKPDDYVGLQTEAYKGAYIYHNSEPAGQVVLLRRVEPLPRGREWQEGRAAVAYDAAHIWHSGRLGRIVRVYVTLTQLQAARPWRQHDGRAG